MPLRWNKNCEGFVLTELSELFELAGAVLPGGAGPDEPSGFPLALPLSNGAVLDLNFDKPPLIANLDPESIGVATFDSLGRVKASWGLAERIPFLQIGKGLLDSPLRPVIDLIGLDAPGSVLIDGCRYYVSGVDCGLVKFVLVVDARDEFQAKRLASLNGRSADALKRLGKTLTMHQNREPLCVAATHEIASSLELAAVLLWVVNQADGSLDLMASVGATRQGCAAIRRLNAISGSGCVAEIVAATRETFNLEHVADHLLTAELEAKLCYLKPGGLSIHPLEIGGKLLGVLELIGREGDPYLASSRELFETIAEHLALAINSADLFENLEGLASHDPLTGLANHRFLQEFLHQRVHEAARTGQLLSLLMVDVDHFRAFNEEEGHDAGDEVLRQVAEALKSCVRPYDVAARYGGEEFVVVMPGSDIEAAAVVAERLRKRVEMRPYVTKSGRHAHVSVSIGVAGFPDSAKDAFDVLKAADIALYEAKKAGRNVVIKFAGRYEPAPRTSFISLEDYHSWIPEADWEDGVKRLERLEPDLEGLSIALTLSESQIEILRSLIVVGPTYLRWVDDRSNDLDRADAAEEFRVLLPSLQGLRERYDGRGPRHIEGKRIPLLGRVLQILLAIDSSQSLYEDHGRFDPEMIGLVTALHRAA